MKITNVFGEFSGKLGGAVFSHNKGGAYVRRFVTPTNPRTQKQVAVRERFSQRTHEFRSLSPEIRSMWLEYSNTLFNPLTGTGKGGALNAFLSCRQAVDNANNAAATTTFDVGVQPRVPFVLPTFPPSQPLAANIRSGELKIIPSLERVEYQSGVISAFIRLPGFIDASNVEFVNEHNVNVSLNVYISSPSGGDYYSNPYRNLVAATAGYTFNEIDGEKFTMSGQITLQSKSNYRATLVIMDQFGQQLPVSTLDFTVPANP